MKILHINTLYYPNQVGGAEKSLQILAEAQVVDGHDVYVLCTGQDNRTYENNGVKIFQVTNRNGFWIKNSNSVGFMKRFSSKIKEGCDFPFFDLYMDIIKKINPDIINTHSLVTMSPSVWKAANILGVKSVHTLRDYDILCRKSNITKNGKMCNGVCFECQSITFLKKNYIRYLDGIVSIGEDILDYHLKNSCFNNIKSRVIWNPIAKTIKKKNFLKEKNIVFGYIGRMSEEKGFDIIIDAFNSINGVDEFCSVVVASDNFRDNLPSYFKYIGWVSPIDFFERVDIIIVPSIYPEPLGRVTIESFGFGVPVIGSNIGGTKELIGENSDWLFSSGSYSDLARIVKECIDNPEKFINNESMNERMNFVVKNTSPERACANYIEFYNEILES